MLDFLKCQIFSSFEHCDWMWWLWVDVCMCWMQPRFCTAENFMLAFLKCSNIFECNFFPLHSTASFFASEFHSPICNIISTILVAWTMRYAYTSGSSFVMTNASYLHEISRMTMIFNRSLLSELQEVHEQNETSRNDTMHSKRINKPPYQ